MSKYLRFRLRTLFIIVALVSVVLAYVTNCYRKGQRQVDAVLALSVFPILYPLYASDYTEDGQYKDMIDRQTAPVTAWENSQNEVIGIWWILEQRYYSVNQVHDAIKLIETFPNLKYIYVDCRYEDASFPKECAPQIVALATSYNLKQLSLRNMELTDRELNRIAELRELEILTIDRNLITDIGFGELRKLYKLRHLYISYNAISNQCIPILKGLTSLESLNLSGNRLTTAEISEIRAEFPKLQVEGDPREEEIE